MTDTIRAFDRNGNGKVDPFEIAILAQSQGLSNDDVLGDFDEIDTNGDGELDASEISSILGVAKPAVQPKVVAQPSTAKKDTAVADNAEKKEASQLKVKAPPSDKMNAVITSSATDLHLATPASVEATKESSAKAPPEAPKPSDEAALGDDLLPPEILGTSPDVLVAAGKGAEDASGKVFNVQSLEQSAQAQASTILASSLATRSRQLLTQSETDAKKAEEYEELARSLRSRIQALLQSAGAETKRDAVEAVGKTAEAETPKVEQMQAKAQLFKDQAVERRSAARLTMERVVKMQSEMAKLLQ